MTELTGSEMASTDRRASGKAGLSQLASMLSQYPWLTVAQVPKEGDTIGGHFVPGGTIIG